jgi:hypothetical protein
MDSTTVWNIDSNGKITHTVKSQASAFEDLIKLGVSDDTASYWIFRNGTNTDGSFAPLVISYTAAAAAVIGFFDLNYIASAQDSGTVPVHVWDVRRDTEAQITTRPAYDFRNFGTSVFKINAKGNIEQNIISQAGVAELLHKWTVSDALSKFEIRNASATDAKFFPWIRGEQLDDAGLGAFSIDALIGSTLDTGSSALYQFAAYKNNGTKVTVRPLLEFYNWTDSIFKIGPYGTQTVNVIGQASAGEIIHVWSVSDAVSFIDILNASTVDGEFAPWMRFANFIANATHPSVYFYHYIHASHDTGAVPAVIYDARKSDGTAIVTRPCFDWRNNGGILFALWPSQAVFNVGIRTKDAVKTANYTLTFADDTIRADASGGAFTLTLPTAVGVAGTVFTIVRVDVAASTNSLTIDANGSETIDGLLTYLLWTGESVVIKSDGANWKTIARPVYVPTASAFNRGATANRRYIAGLATNMTLLTSTTGPAVNTLFAIPIYIATTTKFDTIEYELTTAGASSVVKLGIYADNGNCYPGKLLFDSGNLTGTTPTGAKSATITAAVQVFQPGLYWLAYENSATVPQVRCLPGAGSMFPVLGFASPFTAGLPGICYTVTHTVASGTPLPDPYTAGAGIRTAVSAVTLPIPAVALRAV